MKNKLHNCKICTECLGQSLQSPSYWFSFNEPSDPNSVDSMGFLVVSLAALAPIFLPLHLPQDFLWSSVLPFGYLYCFHQLLGEASLMTLGLDTNL